MFVVHAAEEVTVTEDADLDWYFFLVSQTLGLLEKRKERRA